MGLRGCFLEWMALNLKSKVGNDVPGRGNGISKDLEVRWQAVGVEGMRWKRSTWQEPVGRGKAIEGHGRGGQSRGVGAGLRDSWKSKKVRSYSGSTRGSESQHLRLPEQCLPSQHSRKWLGQPQVREGASPTAEGTEEPQS